MLLNSYMTVPVSSCDWNMKQKWETPYRELVRNETEKNFSSNNSYINSVSVSEDQVLSADNEDDFHQNEMVE